jgi:hypothetical protein
VPALEKYPRRLPSSSWTAHDVELAVEQIGPVSAAPWGAATNGHSRGTEATGRTEPACPGASPELMMVPRGGRDLQGEGTPGRVVSIVVSSVSVQRRSDESGSAESRAWLIQAERWQM